MPVALPFPGSSFNKKARELGYSPDQSLAERFYKYAGGKAPAGYFRLAMGDYSIPIYNALVDKPNTKIRLYQNVTMRNLGYGRLRGGLKEGIELPWNFAWRPGTANDRCMIVENLPLKKVDGTTEFVTLNLWMVYDAFYNAVDWPWGPNYANGFGTTWPYDLSANTTNPGNRKVCVAGASITRREWEPDWEFIESRGAGISERVGILTADEVLSGDVGHCLAVTIANTSFGPKPGEPGVTYFPPARRVEWETTQALSRPSYDPDPLHNIPEGTRIVVERTDTEIRDLCGGNRALETLARCLRDYGIMPLETGGYGTQVETTGLIGPDGPKWIGMGIASTSPGRFFMLDGWLDPTKMRVVNPAPR